MLSLTFLAKQVAIYFGIPCFIAGLIGGFFNTMVFLSLHTFRENSCAFYLTIMSVFNIAQIMTGLFSRIMITGFDIDWTQTSIFYCKFRNFTLFLTAYMSSTCLCLATIDQYLATCSRHRWQQWCNIKIAHRLVYIFTFIWVLEQIPTLIYYDHVILPSSTNVTCSTTNVFFEKVNLFFNLALFWYSLPIFVTTLFGILAYRNIQQLEYRTVPLVRRELDKQLTIMVLVQVIFNLMITLPSLIIGIVIRHRNPTNDPDIAKEMQSAHIMNGCIFYLYFANPFYIYMCVSERFRRQFFYVVFNIDLNRRSIERHSCGNSTLHNQLGIRIEHYTISR